VTAEERGCPRIARFMNEHGEAAAFEAGLNKIMNEGQNDALSEGEKSARTSPMLDRGI